MAAPSFLKGICRHLLRIRERATKKEAASAIADKRGVLIFANTSEVIAAESALLKAGMEVAVKGPPPCLQTGCDLVVIFPLLKQVEVERILKNAAIVPEGIIVESDGFLEPVSIFDTRDLGAWLMVRAANIKVTIDKKSGIIVNISGGGCPDVPWLAQQMVGKSAWQAPDPLSLGHTLCCYCLHKAYEEIKRIWQCG